MARGTIEPMMYDANAVGFSKRRPGLCITGMAHYVPGEGVARLDVATAARATLRHGVETITVENIRSAAVADSFIGTIRAFEHARDLAYAGMTVGDHIVFEKAHVFTVGD